MKKTRIVIGDIFFVKTKRNKKKFFQYNAEDSTQLYGEVIRVFKKEYTLTENPDLEEVLLKQVEFHTHTFIKEGIKSGYWVKIGHSENIGNLEVIFRDTDDYCEPEIKISSNWFIWKINEKRIDIGRMKKKYQNAEYGLIFAPINVLERINTGKNTVVYPK